MISTHEIHDPISQAFAELEHEYQATQGLILSESDIKCLLYSKFLIYFSRPILSLDNQASAISLHTEIPWYDEDGKLTLRPDITILDPHFLNIRRPITVRALPSKGFEFAGPATILEIKYSRSRNGILTTDIAKYQDDIDKMLRITTRQNRPANDNQIKGIMVIFNKTNLYTPQLEEFIRNYSGHNCIEIYYCTGNVNF